MPPVKRRCLNNAESAEHSREDSASRVQTAPSFSKAARGHSTHSAKRSAKRVPDVPAKDKVPDENSNCKPASENTSTDVQPRSNAPTKKRKICYKKFIHRGLVRKIHPSTLSEIKHLMRFTDFLVSKSPFQRVCREISQGFGNFRFSPVALEALQEASEHVLTDLFKESYKITYHSNRSTLQCKDMQLAVETLREFCPGLDKRA